MEDNLSPTYIYLIIFAGISIMFCLALAFVVFFNRVQRKKLEEKERELAQERQLTERLQQVDKLKDQFLANTSHELRTPLQGILGISEFLYEDAANLTPAVLRENLSLTLASGRRLNSLINDLLDFSKLKNNDLQLRRRPVYLKTLVDVVLRNTAPLIRGKNLHLQNALPEDLPAVYGDEDRLQQILYNLIGNAIKFTEEGYVKVGVKGLGVEKLRSLGEGPAPSVAGRSTKPLGSPTAGEGAKLLNRADEVRPAKLLNFFVQDTGIGIPPERQEAIFQSFEQADGSTERTYGGTGLGLSISRRLVELHGGQLWVESDPEGSSDKRGSTFFFTLPVAADQVAGDPVVKEWNIGENRLVPLGALPPPPVGYPLGKDAPLLGEPLFEEGERAREGAIRILVVDDEPINQAVLKNHLSKGNYQLTQAMNGAEALELLNISPTHPPKKGRERPTDKAEAQSSHPSGGAFDLVILDVMMPRMSGYEVCEQIRQQYLPSELPVIMVTAKNQVQDLVQGFAQGANDYLAKPFSREEFLARVKTQLDLHRINEATGRFVPNEFLRALGRERITEVMLGDHIEREVTVLFTDIRDYTALSESMTPEENFQFVSAVIGRLGSLIPMYKGFVNQYLGDAIMAIFPDDPADALRAAIALQEAIHQYNELEGAAIRIGVGFHSGPLIMGIIGDARRMDAASIADTVNTASRIESLTKHYGVNILLSEDSLKKIPNSGHFHFRFLGRIVVKGKKKALDLYECFDGDVPALREKKQATASRFREALDQYFRKEFGLAVVGFRRLMEAFPEDRVAARYLQQTEQLLRDGVPDDWTGVEWLEWK